MKLKTLEKKFDQDPQKNYFFPLANAYREANRLDDCIKIFRQGLALFPNYWAVRVALGRALFEKGDIDEALKELETASVHVPENFLLHELLTSIYSKKGDLSKAAQQGELVLFVNPHHAEALRIKEEVLKINGKVSQKVSFHEQEQKSALKEQKGESLPEESFSLKQEEEIITATLAELYISQGLPEKAIEIYIKLIKQQPEREEEWKKRIAAIREIQRSAASVEHFAPIEEAGKKKNIQESILRQLEAWLKNIEKFEKSK